MALRRKFRDDLLMASWTYSFLFLPSLVTTLELTIFLLHRIYLIQPQTLDMQTQGVTTKEKKRKEKKPIWENLIAKVEDRTGYAIKEYKLRNQRTTE